MSIQSPENNGHVSRSQAVTDILESIAEEEKAIASILCAEARKITAVVTMPCAGVSDMEAVNHSVCACLKNLIKLQMLLEFKLEEIKELIEDSRNGNKA